MQCQQGENTVQSVSLTVEKMAVKKRSGVDKQKGQRKGGPFSHAKAD